MLVADVDQGKDTATAVASQSASTAMRAIARWLTDASADAGLLAASAPVSAAMLSKPLEP
jgi:hypothetical protein